MLDYLFEKESIREFEEKLLLNGGRGFEFFLEKNFFYGISCSIVAITATALLGAGVLYITVVSVGAFLAPFLLSFFFQEYLFERNKAKKEALIPDLLLQASIFPRGTSITEIIRHFDRKNYGLLGKEFGRAFLEIQKGASVKEALEQLKKRNKSRVIDRAVNLLVQGYESGADLGLTFKETADDLLETNSILRERNATMIIEKYTLIFAGGLIVPAVLGLLVGLVISMDFSAFELLEFGASSFERKSLLEAALIANQVYLVEYALIASVFVANQEGNKKKSFLYALLLIPLSLLTYNLARAL